MDLLKLPIELIYKIFSFLSYNDIEKINFLNKKYYLSEISLKFHNNIKSYFKNPENKVTYDNFHYIYNDQYINKLKYIDFEKYVMGDFINFNKKICMLFMDKIVEEIVMFNSFGDISENIFECFKNKLFQDIEIYIYCFDYILNNYLYLEYNKIIKLNIKFKNKIKEYSYNYEISNEIINEKIEKIEIIYNKWYKKYFDKLYLNIKYLF